jgi:hypothetical protein
MNSLKTSPNLNNIVYVIGRLNIYIYPCLMLLFEKLIFALNVLLASGCGCERTDAIHRTGLSTLSSIIKWFSDDYVNE